MRDDVAFLRTPAAIRERCGKVLDRGRQGKLPFFRVHEDRLVAAADYVVAVVRENYPDLSIPVHSRFRHFDVGGVPRLPELDRALGAATADERARAKIDLAITSVLLDAGSGPKWRYSEKESGKEFTRSEGLAVASFRMFEKGAFSSDPKRPLQADGDGLAAFSEEGFRTAFQISDDNPLDGVAGRVGLIQSLGHAVKASPALFGRSPARPGNLLDAMRSRAKNGEVEAAQILVAVLEGLSSIWPGRVTLEGENLGDVWPCEALEGERLAERLVPFHKLSQWLTYSLFEPLEGAGLRVVKRNAMTGLAEYRNGGLFLDMGVIEPRDPAILAKAHAPSSEVVVEWRALTVALLDALHPLVCARLGKTEEEFPLANLLEGGTWAAGRKIAAEKRAGGGPPLRIESDGTVF